MYKITIYPDGLNVHSSGARVVKPMAYRLLSALLAFTEYGAAHTNDGCSFFNGDF